jgi:hypothetical protein
MRIDFLYYADCPSHEQALARLREVLTGEGVDADIAITEVTSDEEAEHLRFLGSPTIRIGGADIDAMAESRHDYALTCRAYTRADGRITPLPPPELIQAAVRRAAGD